MILEISRYIIYVYFDSVDFQIIYLEVKWTVLII